MGNRSLTRIRDYLNLVRVIGVEASRKHPTARFVRHDHHSISANGPRAYRRRSDSETGNADSSQTTSDLNSDSSHDSTFCV